MLSAQAIALATSHNGFLLADLMNRRDAIRLMLTSVATRARWTALEYRRDFQLPAS